MSSSSPPPSSPSSSPAPKRLKTTGQSSLTSFFATKGLPSSSSSHPVASSRPLSLASTSAASSAAAVPTTHTTAAAPATGGTNDPVIPQKVPWTEASWKVYQNAVLYRKGNARTTTTNTTVTKKPTTTIARPKVAAFDVDGTLVVWRTPAGGWPSRLVDYELWNAQVVAKLRALHDDQGYQLVLISNQGAIRGAFTGKKATSVKSLIEWIIATIDRPVSVVLSTDKKKGFHKPSVRLWQAAEHLFSSQSSGGGGWDIGESLYVGDSVGGEDDRQGGVDRALAQNVSQLLGEGKTLRFYTPDEYFGPSHAARRQSAGGGVGGAPSSHPVVVAPPSAQAARAALCRGQAPHPLLLLLCGAQGSGKSTLAARIVAPVDEHAAATPSSWAHFSQDTIQNGRPGRRQQVEAAVARALQQGQSVIVDRMHLDPGQRAHFVALARQAGVPVHVVVLRPPRHVLAQRVKDRPNHAVQGEAGARLAVASAAKLVFPTYDEGKGPVGGGDTHGPKEEEGGSFALISATASPTTGVDRLVQLYRRVGNTTTSTMPPFPVPTHFSLANVGVTGSAKNATTTIAATATSLLAADDDTSSNSHRPTAAEEILPAVVLGTMGLGRKAAADVVTQALQLGWRGVDTAPTYKNEDKVGQALVATADDRSNDIYCIVKVPKRAMTAADVHQELQTSLTQLQRPQADLLLLHWPSLPPNVLQEVWQAMEAAVQEGKAKALGICNANVASLSGLLSQCRIPPSVLQVERHPLLPQWDLIDFCAQNDIQVQAHTPLGQGKADLLEHAVVQQVAASSHPRATAAQVILAWNLQQGVAVTVKASSPQHLEELTQIPPLSAQDLQALDGITDRKRFVAPPFMYGSAPYCWGKQTPKS